MMLNWQNLRRAFAALVALAGLLVSVGCQQTTSLIDRVQQAGTLVVGTVSGPTTFYELGDGAYGGFDYSLITRYAERHQMQVRWRTYESSDDMLADLQRGRLHVAAAGIPVTPEQADRFYLAPAYNESLALLVQRHAPTSPESAPALKDRTVLVSPQSSVGNKFAALKQQFPEAHWKIEEDRSAFELLAMVNDGDADFAVVSEHIFKRLNPVFPELETAMPLGNPRPLAWALNRAEDPSLLASISGFISAMEKDGTLTQLRDHYFTEAEFDYAGARAFITHLDARLPRYEKAFKDAAQQFQFDWRLLAAMSYQESLWNPNATSSTGVTGIMMLSNRAAREMGVRDRRNANQNIRGGTQYLRVLNDKLPGTIRPQDRLWFAIAAYNMGLGHIYDARRLTVAQGGDPNRWMDVEKRIPLLQKPAYYRQARHGYARAARQAVAYVRNVRRYYDTLVWANALPERSYLTVANDKSTAPAL